MTHPTVAVHYIDTVGNVINWPDVADRFAHVCHGQ
jgi:superoxide dismutase